MATKRQQEYKASNGSTYVPGIGFVKPSSKSTSSAGPQPAKTSNISKTPVTDYLNKASNKSSGSSGGSSSGSNKSNTSNTSKNTYTAPTLGNSYDSNIDYQSIINSAVDNGDYMTAAKAEQLRNQKIIAEGLNYDRTNTYGGYLDGTDIDLSTVGINQMNNGASVDDVQITYDQRNKKISNNEDLSQYENDWVQNAMWNYITGGIVDENMPEDFEYDDEMPTQPKSDPRIDKLLNQYLNREAFSYDLMNDPLYQQYAEQYRREGDRAMREAMAEAASGAGGMNSWAMTAANQANQYYNSQLNDIVPELYNLAYQKYLNDIELQVQDLGILQDMDATQYNRYRDTINDWYNDRNFAYQMYRDDVQQGNWKSEFDYNALLNNRNFNYDSMWQNKEWDYNTSQKEQEQAKEEVWNYIALGIVPNADLIKKSGMSEADVQSAVKKVKAEQAQKALSSVSKSSGKTSTKGSEGEDEMGTIEALTKGGQQVLAAQGAEGVDSYLREAMAYGIIDQNTYLILYDVICGQE